MLQVMDIEWKSVSRALKGNEMEGRGMWVEGRRERTKEEEVTDREMEEDT